MVEALDPGLFEGLSVYQDVVLAGQTVRKGVRDCDERWRLIEPHLPRTGALLDVGSNFGWFGLKICQSRPECVVASVEADPRSALVQRKVLESHEHRRIALLTSLANCRMLARFASVGQRFDAALCLSTLHWLPDHREFLARLGEITPRIVIEYPHPDEHDAGSEKIRREIGEIGSYLRSQFPDADVRRIGDCASHLAGGRRRPIWLVTASRGAFQASPGLALRPLFKNGMSWPPKSWWSMEFNQLAKVSPSATPETSPTSPWVFTPRGLEGADPLSGWRRQLNLVPEKTLFPRRGLFRRQLRRVAGNFARRVLPRLAFRGC